MTIRQTIVNVVFAIALAILSAAQCFGNDLTIYETDLIDRINYARTSQGLGKLTPDATLMAQSRRHSERQANRGSMHHSSGGFGGECVAVGQRDPKACLDAWWRSSGHYRIVVGKGFTRIGVAGYRRNGSIYWTFQAR